MARITGILVGIALFSCGAPDPTGALSAPTADTPSVDTLVVTAPVALGAVLTTDHLTVRSHPASLRPADTLATVDQALGRRAALPLAPGDVVRVALLAPERPLDALPVGSRLLLDHDADLSEFGDGAAVDVWHPTDDGWCLVAGGLVPLRDLGFGVPAAQVQTTLAALGDPGARRTLRRADDPVPEELLCR